MNTTRAPGAMRRTPVLVALLASLAGLPMLATLPVVAEPSRVVISAERDRFDAASAEEILAALSDPAAFEMSNGQRLRLQTQGDTLRMRYGSRSTVVMVVDEQNQFVSRDRQLVLHVGVDERGEASQVSLAMPASWQ